MRRLNNSSSAPSLRSLAAFARPRIASSSSALATTSRPLSSARRGFALHLRPLGARESVFDAFARDPFFRPIFEEFAAETPITKLNGLHSTVGRPVVPKEGPRLRPLPTRVNVMETNQAYAIEAEMPGIRKSDIKIEVREGDQLVIRGEKHFENVHNTEKAKAELKETKEVSRDAGSEEAPSLRWHTFERSYGTFERTFVLPENADASKIRASYTDGVLKVEIPKVAKETPKSFKIEIH